MSNVALVAFARPVALADREYPIPALSMLRLANVAIPATAAVTVVPESSASLVSVPSVIVSVTVPVKLASVWPVESCAATCTAGLTVASAFVACGCTVNTRRDARCAPAAPAKISEIATPAHHGITLCGRMFKSALDGASRCGFHGGP